MAKSKEVEEAPPAVEVKNTEEEEQAKDRDQKAEKKRKRGRQKEEKTKSKKKRKQKETVERPEERWPARERRQVVRFSVPTPQRISLPKNPKIEQGPGTKLGDIPNGSAHMPGKRAPVTGETSSRHRRNEFQMIFKLSKRKADDNLNVLHTIIFRRKSKVHFLKRNILQFSGYVWSGNEEKERAKVKEKLDKCTKDKLVDFCQLFDIPLNKSIIKKEEVSAKLMEFLESPYVTRDVILAEKSQQGEKQKRTKVVKRDTSEGKSSDGGYKKRKGTPGNKMKKRRTDSLKVDEVVGEDSEKGETDEKLKKSVPRRKNSETSKKVVSASKTKKASPIKKGETEDKKDKRKPLPRKKTLEKSKKVRASKVEISSSVRKGTSQESSRNTTKYDLKASSAAQGASKTLAKSKKASLSDPIRKGSKAVAKEKVTVRKKDPVKSSKKVSKFTRMRASSNDNGSAQPSTSNFINDDTREGHNNEKPAVVDKSDSTREAISSISKVSTKEQGKLKGGRKIIKGPSREEMLSVVNEIFKDVDFDVVTLSDILKQLESHFHVDLMARKDEVTSVIEEAINSMSDAEEDDREDPEEDNGEDTEVEKEEGTKDKSDGKDGDE